jgi:hypothetical protein
MRTCQTCGKQFTPRHWNHKVSCGPRCQKVRSKSLTKVQKNPLGRPLRAHEQGPFGWSEAGETWQERWQKGVAA